jgi:hypothetical protein
MQNLCLFKLQLSCDIQSAASEKMTVEMLFLETSGEDKQIDWMELKQLLDYICYKGELI